MKRIFLCLTLVAQFTFQPTEAGAQAKAVYRSGADDLVTVRSITLLPIFDNLRGIYSRPVESHLLEHLKANHKWEYRDANTLGPLVTPDDLEQSTETLSQVASSVSSDAFVATSIVKGPSGIAMKMSLFLKADQKLLAQEVVNEIQKFDVDSINESARQTLDTLMRKVPYAGVVLSRQGTRVTINLGKKDNVTEEQMLSAIQIIKLNRHPKFNFLVSTEKEIVGKIKILKVEDTLSFGRIVTEKEAGSIQTNTKIGFPDSIVYSNTNTLSEDASQAENLDKRADGKVSFGDGPQEWLPKRNPTFGSAGVRFGFGQFLENIEASNVGEASSPIYPTVSIDAELWLTPEWTIHANLKQGIVTTDDPSGNTSELSRSLSAYELLFGYNLRLMSTLNSPKVEGIFGYSTYRMTSDSNAFSTKTYSGLKFGVAGSYPLPGSSPYSIGAQLYFMFKPELKESPTSSGSAENSVNNFGFYMDKTLSINLKARAQLDFELYSSDFSGGSISSSSQKHTTLSAGVSYLF